MKNRVTNTTTDEKYSKTIIIVFDLKFELCILFTFYNKLLLKNYQNNISVGIFIILSFRNYMYIHVPDTCTCIN